MKYLLVVFLILVVTCCNQKKVLPEKTVAVDSVLASQESWDSIIDFTEDGYLKAKLYSKHLLKFDDRREILLDTIRILFYNQQGLQESELTADRGKVDEITKNMYAYDNVIAKNDSGVVLNTNELMWRESDRKILSDKFVTLTSKTEIIKGYGFEADQNIKNYRVFKPIIDTEMKDNKQ